MSNARTSRTRATLTRASLLLALLLSACTTPRTQVVLLINADDSVRAAATGLRVEVEGGVAGEGLRRVLLRDLSAPTFPQTLTLTPEGGDASRIFRASASATLPGGVVMDVRQSGYVAGESRLLLLHLTQACVGVSCSTGETCFEGACRADFAEPSNLPPFVPPQDEDAGGGLDAGDEEDAGPVDAGPPVDSGPFDAGPDAGPFDAGSGDAGPLDAGMGDGGPDAGPELCRAATLPSLSFVNAITGLERPVLVTEAPGHRGELFVVEQTGTIRVFNEDGSAAASQPFIDISSQFTISGNDERGLLGLAFHPDFATNDRFYIAYTTTGAGRDRVAEHVRTARYVGNPTSRHFVVDEPTHFGNHNGGMIAFGPTGLLYYGMGDGGGANDPMDHGQDFSTPHGALLRLDVDRASPYVAPGNPFVGMSGRDGRIFAYGLRNPWRFTFDSATDDIYIGDVGQNAIEEIDFIAARSTGGENFGWAGYEGTLAGPSPGMQPAVHDEPIYEYQRNASATPSNGCSVSGGAVYRGSAIPELNGYYIFGDFCSSEVVAIRYCPGAGVVDTQVIASSASSAVSFSFINGELYMVQSGSGRVRRLIEN